jgi:hypothetical protein
MDHQSFVGENRSPVDYQVRMPAAIALASTAAVAGAAVAVTLEPPYALTLIGIVVAIAFVWVQPMLSLVALVVSQSVGYSTILQYRVVAADVPINVVDASNLLVMTLAAWRVASSPRRFRFSRRSFVPVLLFVAGAVPALLVGISVSNTSYDIAQDARIPLFFLGSCLGVMTLVTTRRRLVATVWLLVLAPVVTAVLQLNRTILGAAGDGQGFEAFRDPTLPLDFVAAAMWLALAVRLYRTKEFQTKLAIGLVPFYGCILLLALVRGVWVGVIAAAIILLVLEKPRRSVAIVVMSAVLIAATLYLTTRVVAPSTDFTRLIVERASAAFTDDDPSVVSRIDEWRGIVNTVGSSWLFGRGLGANIESLSPQGLVQTTNTHSSLLWYFLKGGVLWAAMLVGCFVYIASMALTRFWTSRDALYKGIALGVVLCLVDFAAASLTSATFHAPNYVSILGMLCGLLYVMEQADTA